MADGTSYSDILRQRRERAGLTLNDIANAIRVRPDIVRAIENADFANMPARGYTRNMIRAYAKYVGLDENDISNRYLDEFSQFEYASETGDLPIDYSADGYAGNMAYRQTASRRTAGTSTPRARYAGRGGQGQDSSYRQRAYRDVSQASLRRRQRDGSQAAEDGYDSSDGRSGQDSSLRGRQYRRGMANARNVDYSQANSRSINFSSSPARYSQGRTSYVPRSRVNQVQMSHGARSSDNRYVGPSGSFANRLSNLNLRVVGIVAAVVLVVLIVVIAILVNRPSSSVDDIPDIPISGLTDTSNSGQSSSSSQVAVTEVAPTYAEFTYEVADGGQSWIEIYLNGSTESSFAEVVSGPASESYQVTGTLLFRTANPTPVTCSVDGTPIELTAEGNDYYSCQVDFVAILEAWNSEHLGAESSSSSSSASSSSASSFTDSENL